MKILLWSVTIIAVITALIAICAVIYLAAMFILDIRDKIEWNRKFKNK